MTRSVVQLGGQELKLDADGDTSIQVSTDDVLVVDTAGSERLRVDASGNVGINTASPNTALHITVNDDTEFLRATIAGNESWAFKGFSGTGVTDNVSFGIAGGTQCMTWQESGEVGIGTTDPVAKLHVVGGHLQVNSETDSGSTVHHYSNTTSGGAYRVRFDSNSNVVGSIAVGTSSTAYNTSSDYRLKENVVTDWDATTRLKQLKPSRFNFKIDKDKTVDGFIAHEVGDIVPEAISGTKDAMTKEVLYVDGDKIPEGKKVGDVKTPSQIEPQSIDQSKLVPLLTKSLQEALARIDTLEAEVAKLKG